MRKRDQIRRNRSSSIEQVEPSVCTSGQWAHRPQHNSPLADVQVPSCDAAPWVAGLVKDQPGTFNPLDEGLNEFYLWHGTHVRAALSIAHEDFRIDMAGSNAGTMYGRGCYLAENCTEAAGNQVAALPFMAWSPEARKPMSMQGTSLTVCTSACARPRCQCIVGFDFLLVHCG